MAAFRRSGLSATAFCRRADIPRATFTLWQREEREAHATRWQHATSRPAAFARVEVSPGAPDAAAGSAGITLRLHQHAAVTAELTGLDAETALRALRVLLRHPRAPQPALAGHGAADA